MSLIYMRTSPSGKSYIGQTKFTEIIRWKQHCQAANNINSKEYYLPLSYAIRKYGQENFTVKILEENISTEKINERERFYIELYKTYDSKKGYNCNLGFKDQISINLISQIIIKWQEGLCIFEIANFYNLNPKTVSKYLKTANISQEEILKRKTQASSRTSKKQRDILAKDILILWNNNKSVKEIEEKIQKDRHYIVKILKENGIKSEEIQKRQFNNMKGIQISQYNLDGSYIKSFHSCSEALRELNSTNRKDLKKALDGIIPSYKNFIWRYNNYGK